MHLGRRSRSRGSNAVAWTAVAIGLMAGTAPAAEPTSPHAAGAAAWRGLPAYRAGGDMAPLLAIEAEARESMLAPETRAALAARLAGILGEPGVTSDARQWVCLLLRQVGTPTEVPVLAGELAGSDAESADAARQALESIPGPAATRALLDHLPRATGGLRLGIIAALGRRLDAEAVPALARLVDGNDLEVAHAAAAALSLFAEPQAIATLERLAERSGLPTPAGLHAPLVRAADAAARAGDRARAAAIRETLSQAGQPAAVRQAAFAGLLDAQAGDREATILAWLAGDDPDRRQVAAAGIAGLDDAALAAALAGLDRYPPDVRPAILTVAARRIPQAAEPVLIRLAGDARSDLQVAAIECLGRSGSTAGVSALMAALSTAAAAEEATAASAARMALASLPRESVGPRLVEMLAAGAPPHREIVELVGEIRERAAWDSLAGVALADDPSPWREALASLARLANPETDDLTRLVDLLARARTEDRREALARVIGIVASRAASSAAADAVMAASDRQGLPPETALPLLGRLGGAAALARLDAALASPDAKIREAGIQGLCHWPDAGVADRLLALARESRADPDRQSIARQALRAYVRTVSLRSERDPAATLAMLQDAMALAATGPAEDRGYILERTAAAVRTMAAVEWIAGHLDDSTTTQAACRAIVELAHHKPLRRPNQQRFEQLLDRVATLSNEPSVAIRARRYRLGL